MATSKVSRRVASVSTRQRRPSQKSRRRHPSRTEGLTPAAQCRRRFLRFFPEGFRDSTYLAWERDYKEQAHLRWEAELGRSQFLAFLKAGRFDEIARRSIRV